ncbi:glycoside hydrolase family 64 protein [Streptomyces mirabilis]|uniref:glycoside hydrolase family 64 protein n=1 Tax=Streptomyces mirabilis TaxID=68239 RepID=UPI0036B935D1
MITYLPARSKRSRPGVRRLVTAVLTALLTVLALGLAGAVPAKAAADYTQDVTSTGSGSVQIWFKPTTPASLVDVHYLSAGAGQQNFRMTNNAGTWQRNVSGLPGDFTLEYWFTYEKSGPLYDTPHFTYSVGSGGGGGGGEGGSFPITFQNNTRGTYTNARIHVTVLGQVTPGQWSYMKADGTMTHIDHLDANAPGHLTKNGVNYPNMSFTLAQAGGSVPSPTSIRGGRIYVSLGSPLYIPVSPDDQGWGGPDLRNPNDPNTDVYYDWYEYTYVFGQVAFGGNTTQVDQFGFPITSRLTQTSSGYDTTRGITLTRAQVMSQYAASVGAAFKPLQNTYRIIAPRSSDLFLAGGSQSNHLQSTIDQTWSFYSTHPFRLTRLGETFTGGVSGTTLTFTKNGAGPYALQKPSSPDVVACAGALASGSDPEKQLGAEFCAAFNRGVALDTSAWYTPSAYYTGGVKNDYAAFLHTVGLDRRAYAFPYDDIDDQSSVQILGNANPPAGLTLGIGW